MVAVTEAGQAPVERPGTMIAQGVDHVSRFLGLAVGNLYILCAAVTLYEVIARYAFNAPTQWAFEVVMVLCATAWMLSAGFVTLQKRHIGITVFLPDGQRSASAGGWICSRWSWACSRSTC